MAVWDVFAALVRRWYVVLLGVLITGAVLVVLQAEEPVFYSRAQVYFLAPSSTLNPNVLRVASLDLVTAAGIVGKRFNGTDQQVGTASMDVTLFGRGVRDGSAVVLPDNGGQWSVSYNRQSLDVQVVAATPEEVRTRQQVIFAEIDAELATLQRELDIPTGNLITTEIVPSDPVVLPVSGERRRAQLMTLALGAVITLLAVGQLELSRRSRRHRRHAREDTRTAPIPV